MVIRRDITGLKADLAGGKLPIQIMVGVILSLIFKSISFLLNTQNKFLSIKDCKLVLKLAMIPIN